MTNEKKIYLKSNVVFEPLVNQWYAWSFLLQPATYAMVLKNSHLRIMDSFVKAPEIHKRSAKRMTGGPFLNGGKEIVDCVRNLIDRSKERCGSLLDLAQAIDDLNELLAMKGDGDSLNNLYSSIPEPLKGLVELGYDLQGNASARFIESLLYSSEFYQPELQSVNGYLAESDKRSFMLSTPRLEMNDMAQIHLPFEHAMYDKLFESRFVGADPSIIDELVTYVQGGEDKRDVLLSWFSDSPDDQSHTKKEQHNSDLPRIRYFNHATVLVETSDFSLITDPIVGYPLDSNDNPFTFSDLPEKIDYVLLTHNHQDHIVLESLLQLRHRIGTIIVPRSHNGFLQDPSIKLMLQACGFKRIVEVEELDSIDIPGGEITAIPFLGEHGDLHIAAKMAFVLKTCDHSILFAADSNNLQPEIYQRIAKKIGKIDTFFLGMECEGAPMSWLYGSLLSKPLKRSFDQNRRLNGSDSERAWSLIECFEPDRVFIYAMGAEPWLKFISSIDYNESSLPIVESNKLIQICRKHDICSERLYLKKDIEL